MTEPEFHALLHDLADCWRRRDYRRACAHFADEIRYADPRRYGFTSRVELEAFFEADDGLPQRTQWHTILFDPVRQLGAAEYTYEGTHRYHGVALIRIEQDRITHWREYQHVEERPWEAFSAGTRGL